MKEVSFIIDTWEYILTNLGITAEYTAIFGISTPIPELKPGDQHMTTDVDHSSLVFVTESGTPQWFFSSKMPKRYRANEIPKFSEQQAQDMVEEYKEFSVTDKLKLKDLMKTSTSLSYFPLEEASFEHWTYGRFICLGDSIHKMTPNVSSHASPKRIEHKQKLIAN
jgi:FAD dependent monooxygenase